MRYQIAVEERVFIPRLAVACGNHIEVSTWENVNHLIESEDFQFTKEYLEDMFKLLSNPPAKSSASKESSMYFTLLCENTVYKYLFISIF